MQVFDTPLTAHVKSHMKTIEEEHCLCPDAQAKILRSLSFVTVGPAKGGSWVVSQSTRPVSESDSNENLRR